MKISREEVFGIETILVEAIKSSDIELLDSLLYDELLFIAPNGQVITKQMDLDSHRAGEMSVEQLSATIEEVKIVNDTAIVIVVYDTKGTMLGSPIQGRFRYIRIWKKFSDGLKVIGGSCFKLT